MKAGMGWAAGIVWYAACAPGTASTVPEADGGSTVPSDGGFDASVDAHEDASAASVIDGGSTNIQFIGRFDTRDPAGPKCAWSGCRILARWNGTSASVDLNEIDESWMDGAPSEWDVWLDDVWWQKIVTVPGKKTYPIATGLPAGDHQVELYKRSEAQNGVTQFLKFDFGDGLLIAAPPRSSRRIEIIGDSAASGFGIEGVGYPDNDCPDPEHGAKWQNFRKAFGPLLGAKLNAEIHGTVFSGKGIVKNIWRPDTEPMPAIFKLTNPNDSTSVYDFAWQPDVVIVMIGGNDFAEGQPDEANGHGPTTPAAFGDGYRAFVETLRTTYPDAHLLLTVSPSVTDADPPGRNSRTNVMTTTMAIEREHRRAGDKKVHAFAPRIASGRDLKACNGHGTPEFHTRVANELAVVVKEETGW